MTKRRLQTALVGRIRVAVPCTASDPASVQAAMDAIKGLVGRLPEGSALEFIGSPDFGKTPVVEKILMVNRDNLTASEVVTIEQARPAATLDEIPESLRRVPRHA